MAAKKEQQKQCFVVGPIGHADSEDRIHADWLLEEIIQPVFEEHFQDFRVERADKISNPGQITTQIITALLEAELVIADLTTLNPNAFYEIGIRHMAQKPVIHMHLEGQSIPFDIAPFRSIPFSRKRPSDLKAARRTLQEYTDTTQSADFEVVNPVTISRGKVEFERTATPPEKIIQDQLAAIHARVSELERTGNNPLRAKPDGANGGEVIFLLKPDAETSYTQAMMFVENELPLIFRKFTTLAEDGETIMVHATGPSARWKLGELVRKARQSGITVQKLD